MKKNITKTNLYCQGLVSKDDIRCEACGVVDELNSFLGLAKSVIRKKEIKKIIENIQRDLFLIGAEISTNIRYINRLKKRVAGSDVSFLEEKTKILKRRLKVGKGWDFTIPGEDFSSSILDVCRAITRRLERRSITLQRKKMFKNKHILRYLNTLSNFLYFLARSLEKTPHFKKSKNSDTRL